MYNLTSVKLNKRITEVELLYCNPELFKAAFRESKLKKIIGFDLDVITRKENYNFFSILSCYLISKLSLFF